jgi:hypothetical protein
MGDPQTVSTKRLRLCVRRKSVKGVGDCESFQLPCSTHRLDVEANLQYAISFMQLLLFVDLIV